MADLTTEQRERIADAADAALDYGRTWIRFLRNGNESMLLPVVADLLAEARADEQRKMRVWLDKHAEELVREAFARADREATRVEGGA